LFTGSGAADPPIGPTVGGTLLTTIAVVTVPEQPSPEQPCSVTVTVGAYPSLALAALRLRIDLVFAPR
jgi:hypothetical protein